MKEITPDYYEAFQCVAGDCRHTCCRGWEIDIDGDALAYYNALPGELGDRLRREIEIGADGTAQFRLREDERCPFLNDNNLCELIPTLGEAHLCQICRDHPRFRNFFSDRTETGLGLCCEAAARLILSRREKTRFIETGEETLQPEEEAIVRMRERLIALMQDRSVPIDQRYEALLAEAQGNLPALTNAQWADFLFGLERLEPAWERRLDSLRRDGKPIAPDPVAEEQLCVYFLFRHLAGAVYDGDLAGRAVFAVLSCRLICGIWAAEGGGTSEELIEIAREYSSEIEYSEDNLCAMLDLIDRNCDFS